MFTSYGLELSTRVLSLKTITLDGNHEKLNLSRQDKVVAIERIRSLKKEPYIYSIDYIPRSALKKEITHEMVEGSLLRILEEEFDIVLEYSLAKIQVVEREQFESREESLQDISSWLLLEQVNFNQNGEPIIYSRDYNRSDKLQFFVRRYRSLSREANESPASSYFHGEQ
jgi:GntR family transcriptional regulator